MDEEESIKNPEYTTSIMPGDALIIVVPNTIMAWLSGYALKHFTGYKFKRNEAVG